MGPASLLLAATLLVASCAAFVAMVEVRRVIGAIPLGFLALLCGVGGGAALVNHHYGYFVSWSGLSDSIRGEPVHGVVRAVLPANELLMVAPATPGHGQLLKVRLAGPRSGISRDGYLYLPAAYFRPGLPRQGLPVLELLHGSPGAPGDWLRSLDVTRTLDREVAAGRADPVVLVMPDAHGGPPSSQECVDAVGGARDDTYLSVDVPDQVSRSLRVATPGPHWGLAGFSTGGFCASNLALRHPGRFGAAGVLDGYFHPYTGEYTDGDLYRGDLGARLANDPIHRLRTTDVRPLPRFWLMVGTGDRTDLADAVEFHQLLGTRAAVPLVLLRGAQHAYPAWRRVLPALLDWETRVLTTHAGVQVVARDGAP